MSQTVTKTIAVPPPPTPPAGCEAPVRFIVTVNGEGQYCCSREFAHLVNAVNNFIGMGIERCTLSAHAEREDGLGWEQLTSTYNADSGQWSEWHN